MFQVDTGTGQELALVLMNDSLAKKRLPVSGVLEEHHVRFFQRGAIHGGDQGPKHAAFLECRTEPGNVGSIGNT